MIELEQLLRGALPIGFDSAYPPNASQIAAAKAAGVISWSGYFAGPGILNGWSEQNFHDVMNGGLATSAYCSGWADPVAMKNQQAAWGIPRIILDDESGIRSLVMAGTPIAVSENRRQARRMFPSGEARPVVELVDGQMRISSWVQPWLNASGSGLYGNMPVFAGASASCYVFAAYPGGDPGLSWPSYYPRPADGHPCAWQFMGTHAFNGIGVDSTHYDPGFWAFGPDPHSEETMLTVGPFHQLSAPALTAYVAGSYYAEPFASIGPAGAVNKGAVLPFDGYRYTSSGWQSTIPAGYDAVVWHSTRGGWVPDAILDTSHLTGAPGMAVPAGEPIESFYIPGGGGFGGIYLPVSAVSALTMAQVDQEIASKMQGYVNATQVQSAINTAITALPAYATKDEVAQAILTAVQAIPAAKAGPHHHSVLGLINTGPIIPDQA